jgi:AraC-like DNA-binding protein
MLPHPRPSVLDIRARLYDGPVLHAREVVHGDGVAIADVTCRHGRGRGEPECLSSHMLVFVRRGCFVRTADGVEHVLDPTTAYCIRPGEEQRIDHPHGDGDDCTALTFDAGVVASLLGGEPSLPAGALPVDAAVDLEHRLLLAAARGGDDPHESYERALALAARVLERSQPARVAAGRRATVQARRALVDGAREALAAAPDSSLPDLARALASSPHHLSRTFREATGHTISRHRMRLRARAALERLAGGERDLGRLAVELGFADQSHLCRVVRQETGHTPAALRAALC